MLWKCKPHKEGLSWWCHVGAVGPHRGSDVSWEKLEAFLRRSPLFTPIARQRSHRKIISKSGTRPSWPSVNVKLTHFIFSHFPFSVHTLAISARSLLSARVLVCVWRVTELTEFTCAESSGVGELVGPARPDLSNGEGGPSEHMHVCSYVYMLRCLGVCVCVCVCEL